MLQLAPFFYFVASCNSINGFLFYFYNNNKIWQGQLSIRTQKSLVKAVWLVLFILIEIFFPKCFTISIVFRKQRYFENIILTYPFQVLQKSFAHKLCPANGLLPQIIASVYFPVYISKRRIAATITAFHQLHWHIVDDSFASLFIVNPCVCVFLFCFVLFFLTVSQVVNFKTI